MLSIKNIKEIEMISNKKRIGLTSLIIIIIILFFGCNEYLPEKYKDEDYSMSNLDNIACDMMSDTLVNNVYPSSLSRWVMVYDSVLTIIDTVTNVLNLSINYDTTYIPPDSFVVTIDTTYYFQIDTNIVFSDTILFSIPTGVDTTIYKDTTIYYDTTLVLLDTVSSQTNIGVFNLDCLLYREYALKYIILNNAKGEKDTVCSKDNSYDFDFLDIYNSLYSETVYIFSSDTCYQMHTVLDDENTYMLLDNDVNTETIFYFTDFVNMKLISSNGTVVDTLEFDDSIPLEIIADCTDENLEPVVKSRFRYNLKSEEHIFQITLTEQTLENTFRAVILNVPE